MTLAPGRLCEECSKKEELTLLQPTGAAFLPRRNPGERLPLHVQALSITPVPQGERARPGAGDWDLGEGGAPRVYQTWQYRL